VRLLAIADDGVTLLEGTVNRAVYLLADGSTPQFLYSIADIGAMAFASGSGDALVVGRDGGRASLLRNVASSLSSRLLAEGLTGLEGNIAIQVDAGRAIVTGASANDLWQIDLQILEVQTLQLPAPAEMLQPLRTSGVFLFSCRLASPLGFWMPMVQPAQPASYQRILLGRSNN
jgi:hypothetical protein